MVWFGKSEVYEGGISASWSGEVTEGMVEVKERSEAADEPDREDIDIDIAEGGCWSGVSTATWGKKKEHSEESHLILRK